MQCISMQNSHRWTYLTPVCLTRSLLLYVSSTILICEIITITFIITVTNTITIHVAIAITITNTIAITITITTKLLPPPTEHRGVEGGGLRAEGSGPEVWTVRAGPAEAQSDRSLVSDWHCIVEVATEGQMMFVID